jgi:uncharacterized protein (DUF433 family)
MPVAAPQLTIRLDPMMPVEEHIMLDPVVCHGKPCIRGTRVLVSVVLDALAAGHTPAEIAEDYPPLTVADVRAAAQSAGVRVECAG